MLVVTLARSIRLSLWGQVLTPERPTVTRDVATLITPTRGVSLYERGSSDFEDLARALDRQYVRGDANGLPIVTRQDLLALLNVGASTGGGGGGSGDALVDPTLYTCPLTVAVRDAVYLSGPGAVDRADADSPATFPCIGFVSSKPTPSTCTVLIAGKLSGFTGLNPGATYYIATIPGQITDTPPVDPGDVVQKIGWARDSSDLVVQVDRDYTIL